MNVARALHRGRRRYPERPAIVFEGTTWTYRDLDTAASRVAHGLSRRGVRAGDRVALLLANTPDFAAAYYGVLKLGAIAVSLVTSLKPRELEPLLADCGARVVLVDRGVDSAGPRGDAGTIPMDDFDAEPPTAPTHDVPPSAPAAILYTSGTTGTPKGATLSHGNILFTAAAKRKHLGITGDDRLLLFLPLFHCFGQNAVLNAAIAAGATVVLQRTFDAGAVLDVIARERVTMFFGVPTTYVVLLDRATRGDFAPIRFFFSAAAPLPVDVEDRWLERFGLPIHQGYGLTETSPFAAFNDARRGTIGRPIDGVEMRVVDVESGAPVGDGERGELVVRGPNVMLGYWNRPHETADAFRAGWLRTGDVGRRGEDGWFTLEDRVKDMIAVGGSKVYPAEVERLLGEHSAVREAAVYGVADPVMGERVCAAIVTDARVTPEELIAWCRERVAAFKVPAEVRFVDELPRGRTGKVLKHVLRGTHACVPRAAQQPATALPPRELERRIASWISEKLAIDPSRFETTRAFADHGLNSLAAVELAATLGRWLGRDVPPLITWQFSNAAALARHLETRS